MKKLDCSSDECSLKNFCNNYTTKKSGHNFIPKLEKKKDLIYCSKFWSSTKTNTTLQDIYS